MKADENKKSWVCYNTWLEPIESLSLEQRGMLFTLLFDYADGIKTPIDDPLVKMAFAFIRPQLDRDKQKWEERAARSRENGKNGGRPPKEESEETQKTCRCRCRRYIYPISPLRGKSAQMTKPKKSNRAPKPSKLTLN